MKRILILFIIMLFAVMEASFLGLFKIFRIAPDLLLMVVVIAALYDEFRWAIFYAIIAGIFRDTFSGAQVALHVLFFPFWVYLIHTLSRKIFIETDIVRIAVMFGVSFLNNLAVILSLVLMRKTLPGSVIFSMVLIGPLYTAAIFPLVCRFFGTQLYRQARTV